MVGKKARAGDGRKRSDQRQQKHVVSFRLSEDDHESLLTKASAAGLTAGQFAKAAAMQSGTVRTKKANAQAVARLGQAAAELRKVGVNVNQLARVANETKSLPTAKALGAVQLELEDAIKAIKARSKELSE